MKFRRQRGRGSALVGMVALCVITSTSGALGAWRAPVEAREGIVASAHPEATTAGQSMLAAGGNAVDAAVAVSFALSVVEPWSSGIGGGAFMVLHLDGQTTTWDMREMAPAAAHRDLFVKDGKVVKGLSTRSALASGIPGLVRGLARVHAKHGRLPLPVVMAPAIRLAREGFHVSQRFREQVLIGVDHMNPAARRIFLGPDGEARAVGSLIVQRDKARTLEAIASSGGEDFYVGDVARRLVDSVRSQGGIWTLKDMASYRPVERPAVRGRYRGYEVVSMGPPSSGGLLLVQMLGVLERFTVPPYGSVAFYHLITEVTKRGFAMRAKGLGDPDFFRVDRERFVGAKTIERLHDAIKRAGAKATPASKIGEVRVRPEERTETSHFGVLLSNGDAVACTQTINLRFGSGRVAGDTGVVLNNEMDDFSALPGAPNAFGLVGDVANSVEPGKRPLSSMTPTILVRDGKAVGVFGSPGGSTIITTALQTIVNVVDHGMDVGEAVGRGRTHHQWYPDILMTEKRVLAPDVREALIGMGHHVGPTPMHIHSIGNAMILWRRPDGLLTGAADPRGEGTAGGVSATP